MTAWRKRWLAILASAFVMVAGLASIEAAVRIVYPETRRWEILRRLEWEENSWARPDREFHHVGDGIYALRFPSKGDDPGRLMIVGDSFAMGLGVGEADRFGALLQRNLGTGVSVDVLGVSSYSPVIYENVVRRALAVASYKAVAVFVDQTDPADDLIYQVDQVQDEPFPLFDLDSMLDRVGLVHETYLRIREGMSGRTSPRRLATFNLIWPPSLVGSFPKESRHYRYVHLSYMRRAELIKQFELAPASEATRAMEALIWRHLDAIVALCQHRGVPLFLAANPWEYQTSSRPRTVQVVPGPYPRANRLEELLRNRYETRPAVFVLRMTEAFRAQQDPSTLFLADIHWNSRGHALAEEVLRTSLLQQVPLARPEHRVR
jgi:hypothetical protein